MPHPHLRRSLLSTLSIMTMVLVLPWSGSAQADANPYYIGASTSVGYDSNVFRIPKAMGDTSYSVGLIGGMDQRFGRQRVYASGAANDIRFADLKQLNHTNYRFLGGIDWQTVYSLSGTLSYSSVQSLYNYGGTNTNLSTAKNVETRDEFIARGRWGAASLLSLETSYIHRKRSYTDPAFQANAFSQDSWGVGLTYRPRASLTLGTALRYTQGNYQLSGDFDRYDVELFGTWIPSGLSTLSARLGYGDSKSRNGISARDFSGTTGQLSWSYQPSGKLRFVTSFSRDSGAESGFLNENGQQFGNAGDTSRITNALSLNSNYNLTSKVQLDARLAVSNRSLRTGSQDGNDTLRTASLGASYAVLRNARVGCSVRREARSASGLGSYDFRNSSVSCSAQISLQ